MGKVQALVGMIRREGLAAAVRYIPTSIGKWRRTRRDANGELLVTLDGCDFPLEHPLIRNRVDTALAVGEYELPERLLCRRHLNPATPVIELGANIGVVSCVVNRHLSNRTRHVAVEANPRVIELLEANRKRNACGFQVKHAAIAYGGVEEIEFPVMEDSLVGRVGHRSSETAKVRAETFAGILRESGFEKCSLVMDIEGMEVDVVQNDLDTLERFAETLVVEFHPHFRGEGTIGETIRSLEGAGFQQVDEAGQTKVFHHQRRLQKNRG